MAHRIDLKAYLSFASGLVAAVCAAGAQAQDSVPEEIFVTGSRISRQGFDAPTPVTAIDNDYLHGPRLRQRRRCRAAAADEQGEPDARDERVRQLQRRRADRESAGPRRGPHADARRRPPAHRKHRHRQRRLNLIPPLLLDRTEIVTGGASAAYGSDAVAGVINVILDKDLEGVRWQADMYQSAEGDGTSRHVSAGGGTGAVRRPGALDHRRRVRGCRGRRFVHSDARLVPQPARHRHELAERASNPAQPRNIITNDVVLGNMTSAGMIVGGELDDSR